MWPGTKVHLIYHAGPIRVACRRSRQQQGRSQHFSQALHRYIPQSLEQQSGPYLTVAKTDCHLPHLMRQRSISN